MDLTFEDWLNNQQSRKDLVGAFARAVHTQTIDLKPTRHKRDEHKLWADVVIHLNRLDNYTVAFNDAWQEFLLAKETTKDLPEN